MNVVLFTLDERLYLPSSVAMLAEALGPRIACILAFPPPARGGRVPGAIRQLGFLGARGALVLGTRWARKRLGIGGDRKVRSISAVGARHGIPTASLARVASAETAALLDRYPADVLVSLSCPQRIGKEIRDRFPAGSINVHTAPLPRYRGLMPSFWILAQGETRTAVTVHDLVDALDAGDILVQREIEVHPDDSWDSLVRRSKVEGVQALLEALRQLESGTTARTPNPDAEATKFGFPTWRDARAFRARGGRIV